MDLGWYPKTCGRQSGGKTQELVPHSLIFIIMEWSNILTVKTFNNGDPIPQVSSINDWITVNEQQSPAWCYYNDDPSNESTYGILYNWYAVIDPRGIAPDGYHIPTDSEFESASPSDFTLLPGCRHYDGQFGYIDTFGYYWASDSYDDFVVWYRRFDGVELHKDYNFKNHGYSIKCIKNV